MASTTDGNHDDGLGWKAASDDLVAAWSTTTALLGRMAQGEPVDPNEVATARREELRALLEVTKVMAAYAVVVAEATRGGGDAPALR